MIVVIFTLLRKTFNFVAHVPCYNEKDILFY